MQQEATSIVRPVWESVAVKPTGATSRTTEARAECNLCVDEILISTQQFPSFDGQGLGYLFDIVDPDIPVAAFHGANICPIDAGPFR